ncbi:LOW QUALITY PROTEIN: RAD51-associated protein 2 [Melopsittacus undulatus]|uniref:LOW QUALITY PROTEIN: RAD51-associated protein 2 n=1 Tax=Melopsittacus undulatus TaxID=13146 RepID=UPI00146C604B|nr:LOW QUALITY PROTEIN: RAD51-associated protein 2 [Melopsittacus undulatus]
MCGDMCGDMCGVLAASVSLPGTRADPIVRVPGRGCALRLRFVWWLFYPVRGDIRRRRVCGEKASRCGLLQADSTWVSSVEPPVAFVESQNGSCDHAASLFIPSALESTMLSAASNSLLPGAQALFQNAWLLPEEGFTKIEAQFKSFRGAVSFNNETISGGEPKIMVSFMPNTLIFLIFRTASASMELTLVNMESTCSERFFSATSDETECYLYPKRIKIESNQKRVGKEEQQKLEQSTRCVNRYQTSPYDPVYLSERQNNWALQKQSCDTTKTCMRNFVHFQTCNNEILPCSVSENKLSSKKCSSENKNQSTTEDVISLNVHGQPLPIESLSVWSGANTCKSLQVLDPPQVQRNSNIGQNNKRNSENELKQNSSVTPLNRDSFQMELLYHKSVSDKKWKQYQLLQIPFLCGTSSVFSHTQHGKNNFLGKVCSIEDKYSSSSANETTAEREGKEKNLSSYTIPTLKPFKNIQPLEIPNFQLPCMSSKTNSEMASTLLKETDWKNFQAQPSLVQFKQICGVQKISEIEKQELKNDKSSVKASTVGSELGENNCPPISKQEHCALAEGGRVFVTSFRGNGTDIEFNQTFAENEFKDQLLENSEGDNDQKSKIHIYVSSRNVQNKKCVSGNDLLKRTGRKSSKENVGHIQTSIPVITEVLEKSKLDTDCGGHKSNTDVSLYEAHSQLSTKDILDFKRYLTKTVIFERNCPRSIAQNFPVMKVSCNIFRGNEMFKLKLSFQNTLFGWVRTWPESPYKGMPMCQDYSVIHRFNFCEILNKRCDAQKLVKSNINRNLNNKILICLLAIISKHLKVESPKAILASFLSSRNTLEESMQVEKQPLCERKQNQLNSCTDNALRQTTEFYKKNETYPGFLSSKSMESIGFAFHNECQRRHFSTSLGEQESTFLKRGTLFHDQKRGLYKRRHVRKHHLLPRESEGFSTCLRSVSHKNGMKKQILVAKCIILLQGALDCSSLDTMYCCNITKVQHLIGTNLGVWSYFPSLSELKFAKVNRRCANWEISVKQEKKPSEVFNSYFHGKVFKALPFALCEPKKHETIGYRTVMTSTNEVTDEVMYTMKKYLDTSGYINTDRKEYVNLEELQINSHHFLSKKSFPIFDTYEKIPLTTDSEEFDQFLVVNHGNSGKKELFEENAVTSSGKVHNLPAESNDVLILPEQLKPAMEKCHSFLLRDNQPEYCKQIDPYNPHLTNKEVENQNSYLNFENLFPSSSNAYQSATLPLDSSCFVNNDRVVSEDGHCRNSSGADKQSEKNPAATQYPTTESPAMADTHLPLQAKEMVQFSLQGHTQTKETASSEPATLEQHPEYVKEQEKINDEQMHVTNESQCETVMNDLIISYSEDEAKTFIAAEEKLKMHLSIINNRCLEDVKDQYLPLENKITYEFELKRKFDLVLEELHMFHEISKGNENNLSSLETNSRNNYCELNNSGGIDEKVTSVSQKKRCTSPTICGAIEGQNITDSNESSLNEKMSNENEGQKVSEECCISTVSTEELLHSPVVEAYRKPYTWDPAFLSCMLLKEQTCNLQKEGGYFLSREVIRVQPLKTCKGPIRIGLSRKARPKQQLHPYLK